MKLRNWLKMGVRPRQADGFLKDDKGATAVEFAMVAPLFFLMLGVTLETGVMMFSEYVLQTSVQEASRFVRTGRAQEQGMTANAFKAKICDLAGMIMDCQGKVTVYLNNNDSFNSLSTNTPSYLNVGPASDGTAPTSTTFSCGGPQRPVALIATYDWDFVIPYFMGYFANTNGTATRRLAGFAMFKNEPFPVAAKTC